MRFSAVLVASATLLAGTAMAAPKSTGSKSLTSNTRPKSVIPKRNTNVVSSKVNSPKAKPGSSPNAKPGNKSPGARTNAPKKLTPAQQGNRDLSLAGKQYKSAQAEYKKAQSDLATARKTRTKAMGELGFGGMEKGFRRSLYLDDLEDLALREFPEDEFEDVLAREFFDDEDELFARAAKSSRPKSNPSSVQPKTPKTPNSPSGRPKTTTSAAHPKKLTAAQRGQKDLVSAGSQYKNAQAEYKKAQADLATARKTRTKAMGELGFGGIDKKLGSRSLDFEDVEDLATREFAEDLMEMIARGYYGDEFEEEF